MNIISTTPVVRMLLRQRALLITVLAIAGLLINVPAYSQSEDEGGSQGNAQQALQEIRQQLRDIQQQLTQIQQNTIESYPELKEKEEAFRKKLMAKMRENGYAPNEEMDRMNELRTKLQDNADMEGNERQELIREFQMKNMEFQRAKRSAFRDENIRQMRTDLNDAMLEAMKKEHPETDKLLKELENTQKKLMELRSAVRSQ